MSNFFEKGLSIICCATNSTKPWAEGEADGDEKYMNLQGPGVRNLTGSVNDKRICVPQKIDPKTFFANERTFLKWLSISVMIGLMSLTLLNFGDTSSTAPELAGLVLLPVSIIFMAYSLFIFRDRANKIYMREPMRYDDTRGPTLLVLVLGAALLTATIFSVQRHYYKAMTPTIHGGAIFS
ncbi:putative catalytic subunit of the vacuolar transporter chaperone 4 [Trypanosoma cruzi]|uniref:Vacuolar transporter chaperone, putative n=2 Tax=Trypanosoma cruzi TaxID=5693 RepID=Q4DDY3_TRYCC|nr:vacuolar transporter chaperone, putative [Trypanosoma cruzi]PBJ76846.1 vacuolar transporter chaperone [Trypanosoma cruzi cruzi]EAN90740.1 vacuolar transporter chaperone, putative [Trypanosoma cruzi]KAF8289954.1 putative vacuolar transporter chaperone [Trypanosoma cruzi]PWU90225.1 putative catalytic subunit of the vacuolar transporter chaperone 4 [Trypanosoma cruzi]PWV14503.1 putative catalytic subunit of the vacuolar transporter chaperone 4 [Trypanosoma cruzi]|eukprot:XP_812591.1 vacuolar transporter chaperone [Trypanosoma cruzi strain CL Brener]